MSADLLALLDQLDEARAKATPGPWMADSHELYVNLGAALDGIPGDWIGETCRVEPDELAATSDADAALIVAAVNALPTLTDALRRVLAGCDHLDRMRGVFSSAEARMSYADATKHIRACITAALSPEQVPS